MFGEVSPAPDNNMNNNNNFKVEPKNTYEKRRPIHILIFIAYIQYSTECVLGV